MLVLSSVVLLLSGRTPAVEGHSDSHRAYAAEAQAAVDALQQWYIPETGLYRTTGWRNSGNAITALANFSRLRRTEKYLHVFANTLRAAQHSKGGFSGFLNNFYDDEGWWALAWIDVYDLTHDPAYLRIANSIFSDMLLGWDTAACGGGIWWSKDRKYKNAIANELFLTVAASLANREPDVAKRRVDVKWAQKEWSWFLRSGMINSQQLINDGLDLSIDGTCRNNKRETWSYNQGVILGGLLELEKAAHEPRLKKFAISIALAAISHLTDDQGILRDPIQKEPGADAPQFKGILARNLSLLNRASPHHRIETFLVTNAQSVWNNDRDASNRFGFLWTGPVDTGDAARQASALDLLIAAATIESHHQ